MGRFRENLSVYKSVLLVILAFALIAAFSYYHASNNEYNNLRRSSANTLSHMEMSIEAKLSGIKRTADNISETIRIMILSGEKGEKIKEYIKGITQSMNQDEATGFYVHGVFDIFDNAIYSGRGFTNFVPEEYLFYKAAVEANGEMAVTEPYMHYFDSVTVISYSRRIFNNDGKPVGVVSVTVNLYKVLGESIINMRLVEGGFGGLLSRDLKALIHPDENFLNKELKDKDPKEFESDEIVEHRVMNYKNEKSIAFSKKIINGWHLLIVTPENAYYRDLNNMLRYQLIYGVVFISILCAMLIRNIKTRRRTERRMKSMLDLTPSLGISFLTRKLNVVMCNERILDMLAVANIKEYNEYFTKVSPEYQPDGKQSSKAVFEYVSKAFSEGYCRFEWTHQTLDKKEQIPCEVTLIHLEEEDDFTIGYIRDLREQKSMLRDIQEKTQALEAMNHWHMSILNAIPVPVTVQDMEEKWIFVNTAAEHLMHKKREKLIGLPCRSWGLSICETNECAIFCARMGLRRTRFSQDGMSYKVDVDILKDLDGKAVGYVEVVQDVTEVEHLAKAEAESASKAKSAFLAKTSHEIRTPMNAILGITEIQLQNSSLPDSVKEAFFMIYNSSNLLLSIINNILDLSKIEAGKMEIVSGKYDVASLINDVVQLNTMRNSNKIEFELYVDENIPAELIGDEVRIKQVLNNLLSNAFKYTREGKVKLSITAEAKDENGNTPIAFNISDTGQGMTKEQVDNIFTEYARFNLEANRSIEGTGLGMNIVQHFVNMMKGNISVNSELGKGTACKLILPQQSAGPSVLGAKCAESLVYRREFDVAKIKEVQLTHEHMPYGKVLIVDDLEFNLFVAKGLMKPYGLTIDTVSSGLDAVDMVKKGNIYDIIFMDQMMPTMDGVEATKIIRELGYKHPIVALTANALVGQAQFFTENGFDDFISKPIDIRKLNAMLKKLIRDKQPPEVIAAAHAK
ncbi:MAG: response regulator [Fibromonadales bacterium]|nr:response regulator [Fibromonadales bacterium]